MVRAVETVDVDRTLWTDEDRAWATRAAGEVVGSHAPEDEFLARRASLALERLGGRHPSILRALDAVTWRPWIGVAAVLVAFALGVASDQIGPAKRVNIVAFPMLALLAWNVAVYAAIALRVMLVPFGTNLLGPMRRVVARLGGGLARSIHDRDVKVAGALGAFAKDWSRLSAPLLSARVGHALHLAAFAFAFGVIVGMYVRGVVLEYRAGWESTFLDAPLVHRVLSFVLGPAAKLTGIPVPRVAEIEAIRFGAGPGGDAAPWLHLYAVTVGVFVLLPRALLAALASFMEWRRGSRFPLHFDDVYFQRLVRQLRGESARVRIVPYATDVSSDAAEVLRALVARVYGAKAAVEIAPPLAWGGEEALPDSVAPSGVAAIAALFSLAATPEAENHGALLAALRARLPAGTPVFAIVDESHFRRRFAQSPQRLDERRAAWRQMLASQQVEPIFFDLARAELGAAEAALNAVIERAGARA
jgi:hypothetical protein